MRENFDLLNFTQPQIVRQVHTAYLEAGADIIQTNTFSSNRISFADYGMESISEELNQAGAALARSVADQFESSDGCPRYVAGVLGPTNRTASISPSVEDAALRNITFPELVLAYKEAANGLLAGGADLLLLETIFDTLNAKAAIYAIEEVFEDLGLQLSLMISGTAVRIAPRYDGAVVYVPDASHAAGVVLRLLSEEGVQYDRAVKEEYEEVRRRRQESQSGRARQSIEQARANKLKLDLAVLVPPPRHPGGTVDRNFEIKELVDYIDWTPFFHAWEIPGRFPDVLDDPTLGAAARALYNDARSQLWKLIEEQWLQAQGVVGLFPAASDGADDILVWHDECERDELAPVAVIHTLRQQMAKSDGGANLAMADFVASVDSGTEDWIGMFVVTAGSGLEARVSKLKAAGYEYTAILLEALADRLAEAFAERMHELVRAHLWGYQPPAVRDFTALLKEQYVGIRPAPGYPACPDHTEKHTIFELLDAPNRIGVELTESCAVLPAASVCGYYFARPEAQYFGLGRIDRDQAEDYARRKGISLASVERWLRPNLNYEPED